MNMPEYVWIYDNSMVLFWIYLIQYTAGGHPTSQWVLIERWAYSESCQRSIQKIIIAPNYFRKTPLYLKSLKGLWICMFLNTSGFWTFQNCQYARVLNFQDYTRFTYFRKYGRVLIMRRHTTWKGSEHSMIPNMPRFCICADYTRFWIWLDTGE